jgi:two-component system, response regulator PdtaR
MVAKTVLVVEDDPCIRIVAEEMFIAAGFEVESVQRADHALDIVAQRSEQTAFLFTDVQTPGPIDGIDLARLVKTHWPHVEVLVTSGRPVSNIVLPMECDLLQSRGRARTFLSWQEQPSPNSNGRLCCIGGDGAQFAPPVSISFSRISPILLNRAL